MCLLFNTIIRLFFIFQPRILMAMARDGLLPSIFSDINKSTQVPVKATVATGLCAATLAFFMDVSQLAGMVRHYVFFSYSWSTRTFSPYGL